MSRKQTQFNVLPNEVIYYIFNFLTTPDILRAFAQLNRGYADLVRFYIKRIDLTDGWQGDRQQLQWIRETIQILKVDQYYVHLLHEPGGQRDKKFSLRCAIKNVFTRSQRNAKPSERCLHRTMPMANYQFPQLHSLQLVNVDDWSKVISGMNLKNLRLWFDGSLRRYDDERLIPHTITRFSTNAVFEPNSFHTDLMELSVCVYTIVQLVQIVEHTPNLQRLRVTFAVYFDEHFCMTSDKYKLLETMTTNFRRLNNLSRLSFSTKHTVDTYSNERLPFDVIQFFIDRCSPDKTILTKVSLKLHHIMFHQDMWSLIVRYKNTFDRFDFYASFIAKDRTLMSRITASVNDLFDYHIEDSNPLNSQTCFVHVYSLPFAFDELHGFIACSELSSRISFSTVCRLYFIQTRLARPVSFQSLARRMPNLISIDCKLSFSCPHEMIFEDAPLDENIFKDFYDMIVPDVVIDVDTFNHVRFFRFTLCCTDARYAYRNLLPQLLNRMPRLECLITSNEDFMRTQHPLPSIKRLDLRLCNFNSFNTLVQHLPNLSTLLLGIMASDVKALVKHFASLLIGIPSLKLVCFKMSSFFDDQNSVECEKIVQQILTRLRNMDNRLYHLKLDYRYVEAEFYLYNLY